MEIEILSDWGTFALSRTVKQKACKFALQAILIGHAKREPVRLAELRSRSASWDRLSVP